MVGLTMAAGLVGLLSEQDPSLRSFALHRINENINLLWPEVYSAIHLIEAFFEDPNFPERELAALVAAKVYYQLQEYEESMVFALSAGNLLRLDEPGEFEDTIIAKCIESYISLRSLQVNPQPSATDDNSSNQLTAAFSASSRDATGNSLLPTTPFSMTVVPSKSLLARTDSKSTDSNLSERTVQNPPLVIQRNVLKNLYSVINQLFESCYQVEAYHQVVGIAIEARRLDVLREAICRASQDDKKGKNSAIRAGLKSEQLIQYVIDLCMNVVQQRGFRTQILQLILDLLNEIPNLDYFSIAKCVVHIDQHSMASNMLRQLVEKGDPRSLATAFQISFDLYENGTQGFLSKIVAELPEISTEKEENLPVANNAETGDLSESTTNTETSSSSALSMKDSSTTVIATRIKPRPDSEYEKKAFTSIHQILTGAKPIALNLEFLYRSNRHDVAILNRIRDSLEARNSIFHSAVTFANALMNSGTTHDAFFRQNLEWLGKAVNWSKFTATAALGVIHRGNIGQGQKLLEPYLPKESSAGGSVYSQGGGLYALGLIYTNHGAHVLDYLRNQFNRASEEVVQHGGALGLGVAGMATGSTEIFEELRNVLYTDSAINGEAVGLAMGLVMLGTGHTRSLNDMIHYAHETQHEKIVRGLAMGIALIMYAQHERADELINLLLKDPDPSLRYGGVMTIAMAYCGSGSNRAVRRLLHLAISDVNDDVRRAAVMCLGFVLFRRPGCVPRIVELLSESYNPHIRYGASMALGIACAGTGLNEAIDLLEPMVKDSVDFVRQGTLIALAMIMVQQNENMNPKVSSIRKTLAKVIGERHEEAMAKFGCALALGIIDAGGRNCTIGLQTPSGNLNLSAIVGMAVFTQYWYWFPLAHFLSLAFTPTAIIAIDQDLEIPRITFHSATRPNLFDYPPEQEVKVEESLGKVKTAILSTTAQAQRRKLAKERQARRESTEAMDIDPRPSTPKSAVGSNFKEDELGANKSLETVKDKSENGKVNMNSQYTGGKSVTSEGLSASTMTTNAAIVTTDESSTVDVRKSLGKGSIKKGDTRKRTGRDKVGFEIDNMSRVLPAQIKYITFTSERYAPVKRPTLGVTVLVDTKPDEPKNLIDVKARRTVVAAPTASSSGVTSSFGGIPTGLPGIPSSANDLRLNALQQFFESVQQQHLDGLTSGSTAPTNNQLRSSGENNSSNDISLSGSGAFAAVGVLTAWDEGVDGEDDASTPNEFEYESDEQQEGD